MLTSVRYYRITYVLIILFFLLGTIFFRQPFLATLLIILMILPPISIMLVKHFSKMLNFEVLEHPYTVENENNVAIKLGVTNKSLFPFPNIELDFEYNNEFYGPTVPHTMSFTALGHCNDEVCISLSLKKAGMLSIHLNTIKIYDYLHLCVIDVPLEQTINIPVFPKTQDTSYPGLSLGYSASEDDDPNDRGVLTRDIKDIRQYRAGDSIKDIHWKLTAKRDEPLIKTYERNAEHVITLLPELNIDNIQDTLVSLMQLSKYLLHESEVFKIVVFSITDQCFEDIRIESYEDIEQAFLKIYMSPVYEMKSTALTTYNALYEDVGAPVYINGKEIS